MTQVLVCDLFSFPQMSTMPGLPTRPCFYDIDLDPVTEEITGLFWACSLHSSRYYLIYITTVHSSTPYIRWSSYRLIICLVSRLYWGFVHVFLAVLLSIFFLESSVVCEATQPVRWVMTQFFSLSPDSQLCSQLYTCTIRFSAPSMWCVSSYLRLLFDRNFSLYTMFSVGLINGLRVPLRAD